MRVVPGKLAQQAQATGAASFPNHRAEPPRAPSPTPAVERKQAETAAYLKQREGLERSSILRGLLWLAAVVLVVSILRAGLHRTFYAGWWRQW